MSQQSDYYEIISILSCQVFYTIVVVVAYGNKLTENRICSKTVQPRVMNIHKKNIAAITSLAAPWTLRKMLICGLKKETKKKIEVVGTMRRKNEEKNTKNRSPEFWGWVIQRKKRRG